METFIKRLYETENGFHIRVQEEQYTYTSLFMHNNLYVRNHKVHKQRQITSIYKLLVTCQVRLWIRFLSSDVSRVLKDF